jgi:hypothetical protein
MKRALKVMKMLKGDRSTNVVLAMVALLACALSQPARVEPLKVGSAINLGGRAATLIRLDALPYVESDYSGMFIVRTLNKSGVTGPISTAVVEIRK